LTRYFIYAILALGPHECQNGNREHAGLDVVFVISESECQSQTLLTIFVPY